MRRIKICTLLSLFVIYIIFLNTSNSLTIKVESNTQINIEDVRASQAGGGGYIMDLEANYYWEEISANGTQMTISTFTDRHEVIYFDSAGWNFTFYETEYDKIYLSTNGWMSFTNLGLTNYWLFEGIPSVSATNFDCIALLSEDLNLKYGGQYIMNFLKIQIDLLLNMRVFII